MHLPEILSLLFVLAISMFALSLSLSFIIGPPYIPTPKKIVREMLDLLIVNKNDILIDLGSGDGRVLIEAAKRGAVAKGWEINPFLVLITKLKIKRERLSKRINISSRPYASADLHDATIVFCYGLPGFMKPIEMKIKREASKNVKIVSYKFPIPHLKLIQKTLSGIYVYSLNV